MSFFAPLIVFLLGPFGAAYATAVMLAADNPGMPPMPMQGGDFSSGQMGPGNFGSPGGGGMMGGQQGQPGMMDGGQNFGGGMQGGSPGMMGGQQGMMGGNQGFGNNNMMGGPSGNGDKKMMGNPGGFGGQQGMMGGNQGFGNENGEGMDGEQGMDEEQQKKQEEEQNKRCLTDMKRGIKGMEKPIKNLEKKIAQAKKQKATVPADVADGIAQMKTALQAVSGAKTCDDAQTAQEELSPLMENMQELFMKVEFAIQVPRMMSQINREFKQMETQWKNALKKAKASKADLTDLVAKGQGVFDELLALRDRMKTAISTGDFDAIQAAMEEGEGAMDKRDELFEVINTIEALRNTAKYIQMMNKGVSDMKRTMSTLKRQKKDITELSACINATKPAIDAAKAASAQKPVDPEILAGAFEDAQDVLGQCRDIADELSGHGDDGLFDSYFSADQRKSLESRAPQQGGSQEGGDSQGFSGSQGGF